MRFVISCKWSALVLLNLTGELKLIPLVVLVVCVGLESLSLRTRKTAMFLVLLLSIVIILKLLLGGVDVNAANTAYEGLSIAFLLFVLPFIRAEADLISRRNYPVVRDVLNVVRVTLVFDLALRLYVHGIQQFIDLSSYSIAKEFGLFPTSNVAGGLAFLLYCDAFFHERRSLSLSSATILLLGSLSRVSLVAAMLITFYYVMKLKKLTLYSVIAKSCVLFLTAISLSPIFVYVYNDGSFLSKIDLVKYGFVRLLSFPETMTLIFGLPLSAEFVANFLNVGGWSPHLSFLKALLYYGIFGLFSWIAIHFFIWKKSHMRPIVVGGLIMGLAGLPIVWPPLLLTLLPWSRRESISYEKNNSEGELRN